MARILISLLSSIALLLMLAYTAQSLTTKTSFAYDFSVEKPKALTYQGEAHFPADASVLRLTKTDDYGNALESNAGRVVYTRPVTFWQKNKQANFETTIKFIITPKAGDYYPPADGLVFFIAPVNSPMGDSGGYFGVFNVSGINPPTFAAEFDIYVNEDFDPSYLHVGIDIKNQVSSNVTDVGNAILGQVVTAHIAYNAITKLITVSGTAGGKIFGVSYVYDLSSYLPQLVQVGISAATGGSVSVHDVISWSFNSVIVHAK